MSIPTNEHELITLTVDDVVVTARQGANLIEAAEAAGVEIPHYCYHKHMSIAGNCRMCQVEVEGMPKLTIACNTEAKNGMVVRTHRSSEAVVRAQQATLEFLLINHPLDCTVCDQSGHCKLQDYYYKYSLKPSRFVEVKENKIKATPLGKEVIYDGERCILCTRCVRFCREVSETCELGILNRGDKSVIGIDQNRELSNPLSGTVVDLCPVGALTHRRWRFNSRIWYANEMDTICVGCSTGCNVRVAVRDNSVVHVKARQNPDVNKEWLCDEGRYGFDRFAPKSRLLNPLVWGGHVFRKAPPSEAISRAVEMLSRTGLPSSECSNGGNYETLSSKTAVFLSPMLTIEEMWAAVLFCEQVMWTPVSNKVMAMPMRERLLSSVERKLISPDYSPNARAATLFGLGSCGEDWRDVLAKNYRELIDKVKAGECHTILLIGDYCVSTCDIDDSFKSAVLKAGCSIQFTTLDIARSIIKRDIRHDSTHGDDRNKGIECVVESEEMDAVSPIAKVVFPSLVVHEKTGVFLNKDNRLQLLKQLLIPPAFVPPALIPSSLIKADWQWLQQIATMLHRNYSVSDISNERMLFKAMVEDVPALRGITLAKIGCNGCVIGGDQ